MSCWFEPENRPASPGREHMTAALKVSYHLGKTGQVQFSRHCLLCRVLDSCLPDLPATSPDELLINWSEQNQASAFGRKTIIPTNPSTFEEYGHLNDLNLAKSLYVARMRSGALETLAGGAQFSSATVRGSLTFAHHAHNALGICDPNPDGPVMSGRRLSPEIDFQMLRGWLQNCDTNHNMTCHVLWANELRVIRLIDVSTRRVMPCPERAEYLCLSYVWDE